MMFKMQQSPVNSVSIYVYDTVQVELSISYYTPKRYVAGL